MAPMYEEIVKKICSEKNISETEVHAKVKEKLQQLSDLVSKEGAAHIVANELGVRVYETLNVPRKVQIKDLNPAFKGIELALKVLKVNEIRTFKTASREGRVINLLVGDDTGTCRLVLWDEKQIKEVEQGFIKEGMILQVNNCYVRSNNFGGNEIHMGSQATWTMNPPGIDLQVTAQAEPQAQKKNIKDFAENDIVSAVGTIVQIFEPRFYDACPTCAKKVEFKEEGFTCAKHGKVFSVPQAILNMVFDDGTENIRVVCFRDNVKTVLEMEDPSLLKDDAEKFREIQRKVAGKQLKIQGRVNMNTFFNRLELTANAIEEANPKELALEIQP